MKTQTNLEKSTEEAVISALKEKLDLREEIIDRQRLKIKLLQIELKRKHQWWKFWR